MENTNYKEFINWLHTFCRLYLETEKMYMDILPVYKRRFAKESIKSQLSVMYTYYINFMHLKENEMNYYKKSTVISAVISYRYSTLKHMKDALDNTNANSTSEFAELLRIYTNNCQIITEEISLLVREQEILDRAYKKSLQQK